MKQYSKIRQRENKNGQIQFNQQFSETHHPTGDRAMDRAIDKLVYELYGLSEEEIGIIES